MSENMQDLPAEMLAQIAGYLDMRSLNALRQASKKMKEVADDAAAREAKKIQALVQYVRDKFKSDVLRDMNAALAAFDVLKDMAADVRKLKPPVLSLDSKAKYKAGKATVTKALSELAAEIAEIQTNVEAFVANILKMEKKLEKDLQALASASKDERKTKRGGESQMTYDEIEKALVSMEQARKGAATVTTTLKQKAAELSEFGKAFSSTFKDA